MARVNNNTRVATVAMPTTPSKATIVATRAMEGGQIRANITSLIKGRVGGPIPHHQGDTHRPLGGHHPLLGGQALI